jgi:hypothetical protein
MPQTRLWNDPSPPRLDELPPETRRGVLVALARMIRHQLDHRKARPALRPEGSSGRSGHD